ncbi:unnamed protein product [Peniophora sp. CBMAI 1063]|nr:unnamed protein product [Peniophora sp. CBMAI 1063]
MQDPHIKEGKLPFRYGGETFETYYKIAGELKPTSVPLVFVHGAPGTCHDYGVPLYDLAAGENARPVIFYEQIGTSRSTHLLDKPATFWTFELFNAELPKVARAARRAVSASKVAIIF